MKNFAHLKEESPFYPIFPHGLVPIRNILVPMVAVMEGIGPQPFYFLEVSQCDDQQITLVACLVAQQCGGTPLEVEAHMRKEGTIPLRALHVAAVSTTLAAFLRYDQARRVLDIDVQGG